MSRLLDAYETSVSPDYRQFGLVDRGVTAYAPDADQSEWLLTAPGMVFLQVPPQVLTVRLRLESWSVEPAAPAGPWSGQSEVKVELPTAELGIEVIAAGTEPTPLILPSPGTYQMRWSWVLNHENGPFTTPLRRSSEPLVTPSGREKELDGRDQFCLVQVWRISQG